MLFKSTVLGSVAIFNSGFRRNIATGGGALFAHSKTGTLSLSIVNVNFTGFAATRNGPDVQFWLETKIHE